MLDLGGFGVDLLEGGEFFGDDTLQIGGALPGGFEDQGVGEVGGDEEG